jgi:hypothetical protein
MSKAAQQKPPPIDAAALIGAAAAITDTTKSPHYGEPKTLAEALILIRFLETRCAHFEQLTTKPATRRAKDWLTTTQAVQYAADRGVRCSSQSIRNWCDRYGLGETVDGDYQVITALLDSFLRDRPQRKRLA